jgi:hypothetical protein
MNAIHQIHGQETLRRLSSESGSQYTYVLDFDHTLLLSNSTEEFINCARPASFIAVVLKTLGFIKPWRLLSEDEHRYRDLVRVVVTLMLAPWTLWLFARKAKSIVDQRLNSKLDELLQDVPVENIIIVSFGFDFVLRRLLKETRFADCRIVAPSLSKMGFYRRHGKLALLRDKGIVLDSSNTVVVTDNAQHDADLLANVEYPCHIVWPEEVSAGAFEKAYIPFYYTAVVKRDPGFFIKQVLLEEMAVFILAFGVAAQAFNVSMVLALGAFFLAYMAAYEIGYAENDQLGAQNESAPKLSENFHTHQNYQTEPHAWYWALALTFCGVMLLDQSAMLQAATVLGLASASTLQMTVLLVAIWMLVIAAGRGLFWLFNNLPVHWRVYAYLPLHMSKYLGPLLFILVHPVAYALLAAQLVRTWALYAIRRAGGDMEFMSSQLVRLIFFMAFLLMLSAALGGSAIWLAWETWLILLWCVVRAAPEMRRKLINRKEISV